MQLIGIDIGSTSIKGAVLDLDSCAPTSAARAPFPAALPATTAGGFEIDPLAVCRAVDDVLADLLALAPQCEALLLSGQMGGVVLADESGAPLSNYLSWRDQRVLAPHPGGKGSYYDELRRRIDAEALRQLGHELKPGSATSLLFRLAEDGELPTTRAIPLSLPGFVLRRLCGTACTGFTEAIGTLNLETRDWHRDVFTRLGIDHLAWPALRHFNVSVGMAERGGQALRCFPAVGDHQCALAGAALKPRELSVNISTGSQVSLLTSRWEPGEYQTRYFFDGQFLNTITHLPAGRSLNVLVDLLCELAAAEGRLPADPWSTIARAVEAAPPTDLTANLAFFEGPMGTRGEIANISVDNLTVGTLFRAAFENMAANYETCAQRLSPGNDWDRIVFSGGLALRHPVLRKLVTDRLKGEFRLCSSEEDTLLGLLVLGVACIGGAHSMAEAAEIVHAAAQERTSGEGPP